MRRHSATCLLAAPPGRKFRPGSTRVVAEKGHALRSEVERLLDFEILAQRPNGRVDEVTAAETLWVLLKGRAELDTTHGRQIVERRSLFDEAPTALHCGPGEKVAIRALERTEWAVLRATNSKFRGVTWHLPGGTMNEDRGAGLVQDACRRTVRTIFDFSTTPQSQLVVGEVVNRAGRWSSYPPHHHPQPEIYHYRFTEPQGYGHAELGDDVLKVRHGDTVLIPGGLDHAQVAAPGYGMYYLWVVRHLPSRPYKGFTFTKEHRWLLDPTQQGWKPNE